MNKKLNLFLQNTDDIQLHVLDEDLLELSWNSSDRVILSYDTVLDLAYRLAAATQRMDAEIEGCVRKTAH